jgi:hypothetical protein
MARRRLGYVVGIAGGALLASLLPLATDGAHGSESARTVTPRTVDVPAVLHSDGLRARLPSGGIVAYHLPPLPDGGVRVLGDWNHDGVQTPGIFGGGRWQLWNQVQRLKDPDVSSTFGQPGDLPVSGDWNGDGTTDIGVVRGSEWILALGPLPASGAAPPVWKDIRSFGAGGLPVAGDWDGDGVDGIETLSGRTWLLADRVSATRRAFTVSYGRPGDRPVVGDWDGDGQDGLGVVRGSTWYLSNRVVHPRAAREVTFEFDAGATPTSWHVANVPGATTCPTARPGARGKASWVEPSRLLGTDVRGVGRVGHRVRRSLEDSERYLLGTQYDQKWRPTARRPYLDLLDRSGGDELAIRLPAMSALTVAVGLTTGAFDRDSVGVGHRAGVRYVDRLVRSIACAHQSVSPGGWGGGWETAHWAMLTGSAAWLLWKKLTPQTRSDVSRMVVAEADRLSAQEVAYWARPGGRIVTPGDTKAEEDAWNASLLAFAASMMPDAPHAAVWRDQAAQFAVASYATHPDNSSSRIVNGVSLRRRLDGFNAYENGTVENHDRIHPDYAAAIQLLWGSADFDRLAGQRVPEAMFHNAGLVYSAFSTVEYQAGDTSPDGGMYDEPGGTVYRRGGSGIYYPEGDDWGTARRAHFVSLDAHAEVYAPYLRLAAGTWQPAQALNWHEIGQRQLEASSGTDDGRTYSVIPEIAEQQDTYPGREEYAAQNLAMAWLALYVESLGIPRLDHGTLPVQRVGGIAPKAPVDALAP